MIRPTTPKDTVALLDLAEATGLFSPDDLEMLRQMLMEPLAMGNSSESFWLTDDDNGPVGVAYCEAERMTDKTWNLQMILIHPDCQRQGRGRELLWYVEQAVKAVGGRMLIVETSGTPEFEGQRTFYTESGYEAEACIRDFYTVGDDKVVFRKVLNDIS